MRTRWLETLVISLGFTTIGLVGCKGTSNTDNADVDGSGSSESAGSMTGDATTSATTDTGCTPGELGCDCNGGLCLGDLQCNNGICSDPNCLPGELACECNNGLCLGDLVCVGGVCLEDGGTTTGTTDTTSTTGMETTTDTTTDTGMDCPNANEMMCDGVCVDVVENLENCGECGNVCEVSIDMNVGGCADSQCEPYWSECFEQVDNFSSCEEVCQAEGKVCVEDVCGGFTMIQGGISTCDSGNTDVETSTMPCDGAIVWQGPYARCCCT